MLNDPDHAAPDSGKRRGSALRMVWGCILVVVALFLLLAVTSHDPRDGWVSDYPPNPSVSNVCGPVGAFTSAGIRCMIGHGAYPLLVLAGIAGVYLIARRPIRCLGTRIASGAALVVAWACLTDLASGGEGDSAAGPGGMIGRLLNEYLFLPCGWGAWLMLTAILLASLFFLTDMAPAAWAQAALQARRARRLRRGKLKGTVDAGPEPTHGTREMPESQIWSAETEPLPPAPSGPPVSSTAPPFAEAQRPVLREASPSESDAGPAFTEAETQVLYPPLDSRDPEPAPAAQAATPPPEPRAPEAPPEPAPEAETPGPAAAEPEPVADEAEEEQGPAPPEPEAAATGAVDEIEAPSGGESEEEEASEPAFGDEDVQDEEEAPPRKAWAGEQPAPPPRRRTTANEGFELPSVQLLDLPERGDTSRDDQRLQATARLLENALAEFNVDAQVVEVDRGPVITMYEIELAPGIKIGRVNNLADDIARALSATTVRIVAPLPGKSTVGIEVPNAVRETVCLRDLFESDVLERKQLAIPLLIGKDASGQPLVSDLAQMPHLMIAGATGTGKSVCINSLIVSMLLTQHPDHLKLLLIDPKMVEFTQFKEVPHLMAPVVTV